MTRDRRLEPEVTENLLGASTERQSRAYFAEGGRGLVKLDREPRLAQRQRRSQPAKPCPDDDDLRLQGLSPRLMLIALVLR